MSIVSTTMCYPNAAALTQGIFVQRRLRAISDIVPLHVVVPVPWFTSVKSLDAIAMETPPASRSRMFYIPGILKSTDGSFYARAFDRALAQRESEQRIQLIDAHFEWPDAVGAWRVARRRGLPLVCTLRGKLASRVHHPSMCRQIVEMLRASEGLIAVSQSLATLASEVAQAPLNIHVIPNGIDRRVFFRSPDAGRSEPSSASREALGWSDNAKYVVSVGGVEDRKGFHQLVEVWPMVRQRIGDARLVLVGGPAGQPGYARRLGRMADEINAKSLATSARPVVALKGRSSPAIIADMMRAADLFALATISEGWCNVINEALACGCPVVTTDVGGNREIVCDERLGQIVPFGDREALADAICSGLLRVWDRDWIAERGGSRDWQQVARECVDVFDAVLLKRGETLKRRGEDES